MSKGAVASGHPATSEAAAEILRAGGNAFDAVLGGLMAACVVEPVLASLGGGGFLMAKPQSGAPVLYDFFSHTPIRKKSEADFRPILADFGTATQEFHIGMGSMATPGVVRGLFEAHGDLGRMPLREVAMPAIALARDGVAMNGFQAFLFEVVEAIYISDAATQALFASPGHAGHLLKEGETLKNPDQADFLDVLVREGADLFYRGEVARRIALDCEDRGGHLEMADFEAYRVFRRHPLEADFAGARLYTNPPPSTGGILIAFALQLLEHSGFEGLDGLARLQRLVQVMGQTNRARVEARLHESSDPAAALLDPGLIQRYREEVLDQPQTPRGTTHISVIDGDGNAGALTVSNGEGAAYVVPGTGVVMNNMLGEEDINPHGLGQWPEAARMGSMMAPSVVAHPDGHMISLGSGGSNRIRTALLQVLANVLAHGMTLEDAIAMPRLHVEGETINLEGGLEDSLAGAFAEHFPQAKLWEARNLFFGGVHAVAFDRRKGGFDGAGDLRRSGSFIRL